VAVRRRRAGLGAALAAAVLVAGCSSVIDGTGSAGGAPPTGAPSASGTHDFPANSASASAPANASSPAGSGAAGSSAAAPASGQCPTVTDAAARLTFTCITDGMARNDGVLWTLQLVKTVDSSGWALEEGLAHPGSPAGKSLAEVAAAYRDRMVKGDAYLPNPKIATIANKDTTVDGAPAHLLQTMFTLNTAQAAKDGTKVRQEQMWILAIQVGTDDVTVWHVSVPDLTKSLWPKVPGVINAIKVG
jgi:hypothetical protein